MKTSAFRVAVLALVLTTVSGARAAAPTQEELALARRWAAVHLQPVRALPDAVPRAAERELAGLVVLANYGPVQLNGRDGQPLRIGDQTFARGLYCHAISKILVRLPGAGQAFTATVGIDTNGNYTGGSAEFFVHAGDKSLFRSPVMHRGEAGVAVRAELGGVREFTISVGCAGDNINSDQASWADARVTLADGSDVWLGDLPLVEARPRQRLATAPPFSFVYGDRASDELLGGWTFAEQAEPLSERRTRRTQTYTDPRTGLAVRCVIVEYADFPTLEWTLYFQNTGSADTPILADIRPLDVTFARHGDGEFLLHHFVGSPCAANDYQPLEATLGPGQTKRITTQGGRPTNSDLPYFNLETGGGGVIAVVSWAGQWAADFVRDQADGVRLCGGQELTRFKLHPGEEVRSPMAVIQFYQGDWIAAQNVWRRWMIAHNLPRPGGQPLAPMISACNGNHYPGIITNAAEELHFLRRYLEEKIQPDYWWQDAGWYPCDPVGWPKTGTWEVEPKRWPRGIREVSQWCRERGIKTIVWFEPERVHAGTYLAEQHPEWIYGGAAGGLLKLGDPACRAWLAEHIDRLMTEQGIDLYRQDFNIDPLPYWRAADAEDRQGIAEIRHVEGYLAYWDDLLRRRPGLLIDSCASGGRRNDLETLRRAVPLLRSDYLFEPVGEQNHTYGISFWMPFNGTGFLTVDPYLIRSQMSPEFTIGVDTRRPDQDYDLLRKLVRQWRQVAPCYLGDYYPLTPYSTANDVWMAWQFDRPDLGEGFVQAFRRADGGQPSVRLKLRGLDPAARYTLTDFDAGPGGQFSGRELLDEGLLVEAVERPQAVVITYRRGP
jgi:alpha-galactosidase